MNVLITDDAGFNGSNIALKLIKKGYSVTVLDSLSEQIHGVIPENTSPLYQGIKDKVKSIKGDVVDATILGLEVPEANGHVFNIGTGVATDVLTVANTLCEKYGIMVPITVSGNYRIGDIRHNYADITLARKILGFKPKWSFRDGIEHFTKWVNMQEVQEDNYEKSIEEMKRNGLCK